MKLKDAQLNELHMDGADFDRMIRNALQTPPPAERKKARVTHSKKRRRKPGKS